MQVQAHITFNVYPVAVIWREGDATKAKIFRSRDLAEEFFSENRLWQNHGMMFDEGGNALACPCDPQGTTEVDA